ncbi:MAG: methyltransferase domain-containing protein [Rhodospirillales bacterium]
MHRELLDILICPICRSDGPLELKEIEHSEDDIIKGILSCRACRKEYQIVNGIPRFAEIDQNYAQAFGYQWNRWRTVQVDRHAGHTLSTARLFQDTRWTPNSLTGMLVLDAGCGAGRFTDVLAEAGARVIAIDLSSAIDACRANTIDRGYRVECLQASIYNLPFRQGTFDSVHCAGVIQHTPDPARTMRALPHYLKPGGRLAYNFYEQNITRRFQIIKYGLRLFTPHLPPRILLAFCQAMVWCLFPFTYVFSKIRFVRFFVQFLPICASHHDALDIRAQFTWTLLDTFDWYNPRYEYAQDHKKVAQLLREEGLKDVEASPGLAWGRKP